ncbi:MAG: hypothetical protein U0Q15_01515 [Kineosporiaceae bacterium]
MRRLRHVIAVAVLALTGTGAATFAPPSAAWASCVAPTVTVAPPSVTPGSDLDLSGEGFQAGCYDTGQPGRPPAMSRIPVILTQGGRTWRLATVDALSDYTVRARIRVPDAVEPGTAILTLEDAQPATLTVEAGAPRRLPDPPPATTAPRGGTTDGTLGDALDRGPWPWVVLGAVGAAILTALRGGRRRAPTAAPPSTR